MRRWAIGILMVAVFGLGWHIGAQPQSVAACQAHASAEICTLQLR